MRERSYAATVEYYIPGVRDLLTRWLEIERVVGLQQFSGAQRERLANMTTGEREAIGQGAKGNSFIHTHSVVLLKFPVHVYMYTRPHLYMQSHFMQSEWGG